MRKALEFYATATPERLSIDAGRVARWALDGSHTGTLYSVAPAFQTGERVVLIGDDGNHLHCYVLEADCSGVDMLEEEYTIFTPRSLVG